MAEIDAVRAAGPRPMRREARQPILRRIERQRRAFLRLVENRALPPELFVRLTVSSFRLEEVDVSEEEVAAALSRRANRRAFRQPQSLRIRNHVAILRLAERAARAGRELKAEAVVRWYTSISCGLSIGAMDGARLERLGQCLRRINSPQLRLRPAIAEVAALHVQLINDPLFPGFNGILARLLLQFHLARCRLPPVVIDATRDDGSPMSEAAFGGRLMELVGEALEWLVGGR
jgi:hypothetical protein